MGLSFMSGIGAQVKDTVRSRNGFRPHTSERAPISGAARKDSIPWKQRSTSGNNGIIYQWSIVKNTKCSPKPPTPQEGFSAPKFLEIKQFTPTFLTVPPKVYVIVYMFFTLGVPEPFSETPSFQLWWEHWKRKWKSQKKQHLQQ